MKSFQSPSVLWQTRSDARIYALPVSRCNREGIYSCICDWAARRRVAQSLAERSP
jgi:hypothetical protein